jgi:hypothetical protein
MSYGQWVVNEEMTFNEFGYNSNELSDGSNKPVKCVCSECGVIGNKIYRRSTAKHRCKTIIDGKKKCFKCKNFKNVEEFSKNKSTFDGYQKCCKDCFSNYSSVKNGYIKKTIKYKTNLYTYFQTKTSQLKSKSIFKNMDFDLTSGFLLELYEKQNKKCFFTNIEIKHNTGCHQYDSISVERLDPNKGYTKDNVVLAAFNINSFKGMMNEVEFKEYLDIIIPKLIEYKNN